MPLSTPSAIPIPLSFAVIFTFALPSSTLMVQCQTFDAHTPLSSIMSTMPNQGVVHPSDIVINPNSWLFRRDEYEIRLENVAMLIP